MLREPLVNRNDLQALTLLGDLDNPELDPLAVRHLDNRLSIKREFLDYGPRGNRLCKFMLQICPGLPYTILMNFFFRMYGWGALEGAL